MADNNQKSNFFTDNWQDIFKPICVLLSICIIITLALSLSNKVTHKKIESLANENTEKTMSKVLSAKEYIKAQVKTNGGTIEYYCAVTDGKTKGYIFVTDTKGYGGDVSVMTGLNNDGTIKAVEILDASNETPGLGQNVTKKGFYSQFSGLNSEVTVKKNSANRDNNQVDAVTGATITSKAVTDCVNKALEHYGEIMKHTSDNFNGTASDNKDNQASENSGSSAADSTASNSSENNESGEVPASE